jgi:choline kinase
MEKELSIGEAAYQFIDALLKVPNLDKEETVKIALYSDKNVNEIITYNRNVNLKNNLESICLNGDDIDYATARLKIDDTVYNFRIIDSDIENKAHVFLMRKLIKPETEKVISKSKKDIIKKLVKVCEILKNHGIETKNGEDSLVTDIMDLIYSNP